MKAKLSLRCAVVSALTLFISYTPSFAAHKVEHEVKSHKQELHITMPRPYEPIVRKLAKIHNVPADLIHAVIHTESNYNVDARGDAGEVGLMQIMPMTARELGFKGPLTELFKPEKNLEYGVRYLAKARQLGHDDLCRTILKYNAGYGAKKMNPISKRYCEKVKDYLSSLKDM